MKILIFDKSKSFSSVLIIFLMLLICMLYLLDASAFVHCGDIGICEFLEVQGILISSQKSWIMPHLLNNSVLCFHFSKRLKNSIYCEDLIQDLDLLVMPNILDRFIGPSQEILHSPNGNNCGISVNTTHASHPLKKLMHSQSLQIVGITVIKS